jgi:hypothetical protein
VQNSAALGIFAMAAFNTLGFQISRLSFEQHEASVPLSPI